MEPNSRANLQGLRVISFESRRATEMAELIRRYGGEAVVAPSIREVPLSENRAALELIPELESGKFDFMILLTGVGTRTLVEAALTQYPKERIIEALRRTQLVARGPKPVAALKELGLTPKITVPEPNTWREILSTLDSASDVRGKRIAVQEYGIPNRALVSELESRGATVACIPVYRWALPEDLAPLRQAIRNIVNGQVDVALFTNATQVDHLFRVAAEDKLDDSFRKALRSVVIASVGPVCTQVLKQFGLTPDLEPTHPKMGSLIAEAAASAKHLLQAKRGK